MPYLVTLALFIAVGMAAFGAGAWAGDGNFLVALLPILLILAAGAWARAAQLRRRHVPGRALLGHLALTLLGVALGALVDAFVVEWIRGASPGALGVGGAFRTLGYGLALGVLPVGFGFGLGIGWATIQMRDEEPGDTQHVPEEGAVP